MLFRDLSRVRIRLLSFNQYIINDQRTIFKMAELSKSPKNPETCFQSHYGPSQSSITAYYALSRFVTLCWVHPVLLRPARFLICTVTAVANFLPVLKIWHGSHSNHGLPSLSIPPPCVAPRLSRTFRRIGPSAVTR